MRLQDRRSEGAAERDLRAAAPDRHGRSDAEQRKDERMVAGRTGWIALQKMGTLRKCLVDNESHSGARIALDGADDLPDFFYLYFSAHFRWRRGCRVAWRSGDRAGVEFYL